MIGRHTDIRDISKPIGIRRFGDGIAVLDPAGNETDKAAIDLSYEQRTAFSNLIFDPGQIGVRDLLARQSTAVEPTLILLNFDHRSPQVHSIHRASIADGHGKFFLNHNRPAWLHRVGYTNSQAHRVGRSTLAPRRTLGAKTFVNGWSSHSYSRLWI